jgi:hypothetical protein
MEKIAEHAVEKFLFNDFKTYFELVVNALAESNNGAIMLARQGDEVFVLYRKRYSDEVNEILEESEREYQRRMKAGYTREQAFQDFMEAQMEISKYLQ